MSSTLYRADEAKQKNNRADEAKQKNNRADEAKQKNNRADEAKQKKLSRRYSQDVRYAGVGRMPKACRS